MKAQETVPTSGSIERFGWITKEEPLSCLAKEHLQIDNCILEAVNPFFGYYGDEPKKEMPKYLYWIIDGRQQYTLEFLTRTLKKLREVFNPQMDAVTGVISVEGSTCPVIRMIDMGPYHEISKVQQWLEEAGVKLKKSSKRTKNKMGLIYLNKFLQLNDIGNDMYLDRENENRGFFKIPGFINWNDFKELTREAKFDTSLIFFDAARAAFMEKGEIVELVRIYRENLTVGKLAAIKERYLKLIHKEAARVP